jgi:hypothetical protein
MARPRPAVVAVLVLALVPAGCGRSARDGGGAPAPLPPTTPVGPALVATVGDGPSEGRLADIVAARVEQREGTLSVRVQLARPLDGIALQGEEQVAVGAYLLAGPDDLAPHAAFVVLDPGRPPRFLYGPWLTPGRPIDGSLDGTELTLAVDGVEQGRFRYAQLFAEDPSGIEVLPDDRAGLVAINAADRAAG